MALTTPQHHVSSRPGRLLSWQEALAILENTDVKGVPIPFAIVFVTADEARKTGGDVIRYEKAIWHVAGGRAKGATTGSEGTKRGSSSNWMRKIRAIDSSEIRQVHVHLIMSINGQPVR